MNRRYRSFTWHPFILMSALVFFLAFCMDTTAETLKRPQYLFLLISLVLVLFVFRQLVSISEAAMMLFLGVATKTIYVLYTAIWTRQHDVIDFGVGEGHAGYIEYIFNNLSLPAGDPREKWAFFQPPLHHIISAVFMRFCTFFQTSFRQAQENVQLLTLFYVSTAMIFSFFIMKELRLKSFGTRIALIIICFHPAFTLMSGSINNDALSLMFATMAVYFVILWYKTPEFRLIIMLAICIGLSMMAKLSGGTVAPAVAALFLLKLFSSEDNPNTFSPKNLVPNLKKYLLQYIVFGIIVFPLGIWWEIKNMIVYKMPFNYIPPVGEQLNASPFSRLFDIRMHSVYPSMISNGDSYDEYNVFLGLIKTSLFDDAKLSLETSNVDIFAQFLFISGVILALIALYATVTVLIDTKKKYNLSLEWKVLLGVLYTTLLISYFSFVFSSHNYSAMSFRYIAQIIIVEGIFLGIMTDGIENKRSILFRLFVATVLAFSAASVIVYFILGFAR